MWLLSFSVDAINIHRRGAECSGTVGSDDLEEGDGDFTTLCGHPLEDDNAPTINIRNV